MKTISSTILAEQNKAAAVPAVKIGIRSYGFPNVSSIVRYNRFDWTPVHADASTTGAKACCASDGSLIMCHCASQDWVAPTVVRWATPGLSTDYTTWAATGAATWHPPYVLVDEEATSTYVVGWDIAAGLAGYVAIVKSIQTFTGAEAPFTVTRTIKYCASTDYGVTFGAWVQLYTGDTSATHAYSYPAYKVAIAFKADGTGCIFTNEGAHCYVYNGSTWAAASAWTAGTIQNNLFSAVHDTDYIFLSNLKYKYTGEAEVTISLTDATTEVNSLKDISPMQAPNLWGRFGENMPGLGGWMSATEPGYQTMYWTGAFGVMPDLESSYRMAEINRLASNAQRQANYNSLAQRFNRQLTDSQRMGLFGKTVVTSEDVMIFGTSEGVGGILKISGHPLIISVCDGDNVTFLHLKDGEALEDGIFSRGMSFANAFPLFMCANSTYVFAYNGNQIFISPLPTDWAVPTVGTGAGNTELSLTTSRIYSLYENATNPDGSKTLEVTFDNSDSYFDSPSSGALFMLNKGSRVSLYLGYQVSGVDYTMETARYIVEDWEYSRAPNVATFTLKCMDAWTLLDRYKFPCRARFNYTGATAYTVYELIEKLVNAIGGTLTYTSRSSSMTTLTPNLDINPNDTAGNVMRRLLKLVPDVITFFGLDATVIYPQTTDAYVYYYQFPS